MKPTLRARTAGGESMRIFTRRLVALLLFITGTYAIAGAQPIRPVAYPYEVKFSVLQIEGKQARMAYMDVKPAGRPNVPTVLLFHGKNFNGYYWKTVIERLAKEGFRVVAPDQIGWGKSSKPNVHYSFHLLASNNKTLLDRLGVKKAIVVGHSMGGMLATRFALMHPEMVSKLVLENPIGLEDYRTFVPYQPFDEALKIERAQTLASMRQYQKTYYPEWKPEYEQYVQAQAESLIRPDFNQTAIAGALTSLMIYEQPVAYEFANLRVPTLLVIGQEDRTIVGKNRVPKAIVDNFGQYPELGRKTNREIPGSKLVELPGVGHIPHIQTPDRFMDVLLDFIK